MFRAKRLASVAGGVACLVCVGWIVYRMASADVVTRLTTAADARRWWTGIAEGCVVYAVAASLLGIAWHALLRALGVRSLLASRTLTIYSVSQFGKYVPGSVFQYLGRHAMLRTQHVSHRLLVLCALLEAAMLVGAALIWAAPIVSRHVYVSAAGIWAMVAAGLLIMGWALRRYAASFGGAIAFRSAWLLLAFAIHLLFFAMMGLTFRLVAGADLVVMIGWTTMLAGVAGSWIAGFLIIGAPAGVGVREAVFLALFGTVLGEQTTLVCVSAFRVATFGGDLLLFLAALPFAATFRRYRISGG